MNNIDTLTLTVLSEGTIPADGKTPHSIEAKTKLGNSLIPEVNVTFILSGSATFPDGTNMTQKKTDVFGKATIEIVNQVAETVAVTSSANHLHDAVTVVFDGGNLPQIADINIAAPNGYVVFEGNVITGSYKYQSQSGLEEEKSLIQWVAENGDVLKTYSGNENTINTLELGSYQEYIGQHIKFCVIPTDIEGNQGQEVCEWSSEPLKKS